MKTRSAIDAVAIEEGHCSHFFFGADAGQFFRDRSAFEKAESGASVQFGVLSHTFPPQTKPGEWHRNRSGKRHFAAPRKANFQRRSLSKRWADGFLHPIPRDARHLRATILPKCARGRRQQPPRHAYWERKCAPGALHVKSP